MGHAEIPARDDARGTGVPQPATKGRLRWRRPKQENSKRSTISSSSSPTSTARARHRPTSFSRARSCAWACPCRPRNIFPSNIQGLPTWYEVRVNETGYQGRRGGVDLMVAMNPQTWDNDLKEIESGGYLFYDSSKPLPKSKFREDVQRDRHAAHRDLQRDLFAIRASASFSRTSSTSARSPRCSTWMRRISRSSSPSSTKARKRCCNRMSKRCGWVAITRSRTFRARSVSP